MLIPESTDIVDPSVMGGGGRGWSYLDFIPSTGSIFPGESFSFAWLVVALPPPSTWVTADLELVLVSGADEEHIWDRRHIVWPPVRVTAEDTDGIWPPIDYVAESIRPIGSGRQSLYLGLGTKALRLRLVVTDIAGRTQTLSADASVEIVAPSRPITVQITGPRMASWNSPFNLHATIESGASAELVAQIAVTSADGTSVPGSVEIEAGAVLSQDISGPIRQNWTWVDKPTYHVRSDQLQRTFTFTPTITNIIDEFTNSYSVGVQGSSIVTVSVDQSKIFDANMSEANWWISAALAAGGAISGALASIPVVTAIFAPLAAGAAVEAIYFGGVAARFAQSADDPPEPDPYFRLLVPVPGPLALPTEDTMAATSAVASALYVAARCQLAGSLTVGKVLGSMLAGDKAAETMQRAQLDALSQSATAAVATVVAKLPQAIAEIEADKTLTPKAVSDALLEISAKGLDAKVRTALENQLGKVYGGALAELLTDPKTPARMPALIDALGSLGYLVHESVRANFHQLNAVVCHSSKRRPGVAMM